MKIQYKHQGFQVEAAQAVVDVFRGQPLQEGFAYRRDRGRQPAQGGLVPQKLEGLEIEGFRNGEIQLTDQVLMNNVREVQLRQELEPIGKLQRDDHGMLALSIEMETGTGKTYTYIKTMYELHKHYPRFRRLEICCGCRVLNAYFFLHPDFLADQNLYL